MQPADESLKDVDGPGPTDRIAASRVISLDENQKFINQRYGDSGGPGNSTALTAARSIHKPAWWIGDRGQCRIVQRTADGRFIRTIQMKDLICSIYFDGLRMCGRGPASMGSS